MSCRAEDISNHKDNKMCLFLVGKQKCTSSDFLRNRQCPGKDISPALKGWDRSWPNSTNLGKLVHPRSCFHMLLVLPLTLVRGLIKSAMLSRLLETWRVESV